MHALSLLRIVLEGYCSRGAPVCHSRCGEGIGEDRESVVKAFPYHAGAHFGYTNNCKLALFLFIPSNLLLFYLGPLQCFLVCFTTRNPSRRLDRTVILLHTTGTIPILTALRIALLLES